MGIWFDYCQREEWLVMHHVLLEPTFSNMRYLFSGDSTKLILLDKIDLIV